MENNVTRFVVLAKEKRWAPRTDPAKKMMATFIFGSATCLSALYKAMGGFATNGVNMTKLESYQFGGNFYSTLFYSDLEGHPDDRHVALALEKLAFFSREVPILGVYEAHPFRATQSEDDSARFDKHRSITSGVLRTKYARRTSSLLVNRKVLPTRPSQRARKNAEAKKATAVVLSRRRRCALQWLRRHLAALRPCPDKPVRDGARRRYENAMRMRAREYSQHLVAREPATVFEFGIHVDVLVERFSEATDHQRGGKRPGLAGMV